MLMRDIFSTQDQNLKDKCPIDPYVIVHDKSQFVDSQVLKLQEAPDMVPVGDLPRHTILHAERYVIMLFFPFMEAK